MFLVFDGTSALPSMLDVDTEYRAEQWVRTVTSGISNGTVLLFLAAAVAAGFLVVQLRRPFGGDEDEEAEAEPEPEPEKASDDHAENVGGGR